MTDKATFDKENVLGQGQPNDAFAQYFDGQSFLNHWLILTHLFIWRMSLLNLVVATIGMFTMLIKVADNFDLYSRSRLVSRRRKRSCELEPGKVIVIPANTKHWHGAKKDSWFSHISVEVPAKTRQILG